MYINQVVGDREEPPAAEPQDYPEGYLEQVDDVTEQPDACFTQQDEDARETVASEEQEAEREEEWWVVFFFFCADE
jgi:hypothetical protein